MNLFEHTYAPISFCVAQDVIDQIEPPEPPSLDEILRRGFFDMIDFPEPEPIVGWRLDTR